MYSMLRNGMAEIGKVVLSNGEAGPDGARHGTGVARLF